MREPQRLAIVFLVSAATCCAVPRGFYFEVNAGQADPAVNFIGRGRNCTLFLTPDTAIIYSPARRSSIEMRFVGVVPGVQPRGDTQLPGKVNYFVGRDPSKWRAGVPTFAQVSYVGLYPGIDLTFYGSQRQLEYDFTAAPGASPNAIALSLSGPMRIDAQGDLVVNVDGGDIRFHKPVAYQVGGAGRKQYIEAGYVLKERNSVGFALARYDRSKPLVIDPVITYSTYLGGSDDEGIFGIKFDAQGNLHVAGETSSVNFPIRNPVQGNLGGDYDCFVAKFDHSGSKLIYSTYLGGSMYDHCTGLAVDWRGSAYVAGVSFSSDFPIKNAIQQALKGKSNAFISRLSPSGSELVFSTFLGGSSSDEAGDIALDTAGNVYIAGFTNSLNFPTTPGAYQSVCDRGALPGVCIGDAFAAKLSPTGRKLLYSTYLGGSGYDSGNGIAVNRDGALLIAGQTGSSDFPVQDAFQSSLAGPFNAFVTKLNTDGSGLVFSTYLGGNGFDAATGVAIDAHGSVYVTGNTSSTNFPTVKPFQAANQGNGDGFVSKFGASGNTLIYSTYLGGTGWDYPFRIAVDARGAAALVGFTGSADFPVVKPTQLAFGGGSTDVFVTLVNPAGSVLLYSTFLGGAGDDFGYAVNADCAGNIWAAGSTASLDFPLVKSYQASYGGGPFDAFMTKISADQAESIGVLRAAISNLVLERVISPGDGNRLSAKLAAAQPALDAFVALVDSLEARGSLDEGHAGELRSAAIDIRGRL